MSTTMKALVLRKHGDLDSLEVVKDYVRPVAQPGHVVIRVGASSFNYHDVFTVKGMPGIKVPMPVIIGLDMAGTIVDVGADVKGWTAGDRVLVNPLDKKVGLMWAWASTNAKFSIASSLAVRFTLGTMVLF